MASNDMRIDVEFVDHPKTKRLIKAAGFESFYCLLKLFSTAAKIYKSGVLKDCDQDDIEDLAGWKGKRGKLFDVLTSERTLFLDQNDDGDWCIHDWETHQPWLYHSDTRSKIAKQNIAKRWNKRYTNGIQSVSKQNTNGNTDGNTDGIPIEYERYTDGNTPLPLPLPEEKKDNPLLSKESCPPEKESAPADGSRRAPIKFTKPTVFQVSDYCNERKNSVIPQQFVDFYESKGWLVGKSPMKDWKAAVRTWENNGIPNGRKTSVIDAQSNDRFAGMESGDTTKEMLG